MDTLPQRPSAAEPRGAVVVWDLVEFSCWLPVEHKIADPAAGRRILRDAAKALGLPREVWGSRDNAAGRAAARSLQGAGLLRGMTFPSFFGAAFRASISRMRTAAASAV